MLSKRTVLSLCAAALVLFPACKGRGGADARQEATVRAFPVVKVPGALTTQEEFDSYALSHYWDAFFSGASAPSRTDSLYLGGVENGNFEQALANYIQLLWYNRSSAAASLESLFGKLESFQQANPSSMMYGRFTEVVSRYLYDPNSPLRDEDLYGPFVARMAQSPFTPEGMKPAYGRDAQMCSLNPVGSKAADFTFRDAGGRDHRLSGIKAPLTLLFFSNPGCSACKEIIDVLTCNQDLDARVKDGSIAVVNVYIDEELDEWRAYLSHYPSYWHTGYDPSYTIRKDLVYNVRAIPSLYLLDSDKTVIMKDAPVERVFDYLQTH